MCKHTPLSPVSQPDSKQFTSSASYAVSAPPPSDNMGVNNATQSGPGSAEEPSRAPTGRALAVSPSGPPPSPDSYFARLALDTLQVTVSGDWHRRDHMLRLLALRDNAKMKQQLGLGDDRFFAHDGHELRVFPHGGRPTYQILMRDADGLEVRAMPTSNMPTFIFRFGARWCVENSVQDLAAWTVAFTRELDFAFEKIKLSEVHIRCDVPTPFVQHELKHIRGTGARNGRFNSHHYQGRLSGIDNLGGKKAFKFCIYDKKLEQAQKPGFLWPRLWRAFGIAADSPIWRVEARWRREALKQFGLNLLSDLSERTMKGLWHWFTHQYLYFVSDPKKRSDRAGITRKWKAVQACGKFMERVPLPQQVDLTATQLYKQAAGCIAKALAVSGQGHFEAEVDQLVADAHAVGEERFAERRREYILEALKSILQSDRSWFTGSEQALNEVTEVVRESLSRRVIATPATMHINAKTQ